MLDIETLSTKPDAVILTLGAVKFDPYTVDGFGDTLYYRVDVNEQLLIGRNTQQETLDWWAKQAEDVREEALSDDNRICLNDAYTQLNKFVVGATNIWCQGPHFDIVILENLYRQKGWPTPWQFWQIRDSRTLFSVHGDPREKNQLLHNALADSVSQAVAVQQIYSRLGITKPK